MLGGLTLGVQCVQGDHGAGEIELSEKLDEPGYLVGLMVHVNLAYAHTGGVVVRRE